MLNDGRNSPPPGPLSIAALRRQADHRLKHFSDDGDEEDDDDSVAALPRASSTNSPPARSARRPTGSLPSSDPRNREVDLIIKRAERVITSYDFDTNAKRNDAKRAGKTSAEADAATTKQQRERVGELVDDYTSKCRQRQMLLSEVDDGAMELSRLSSREMIKHVRDDDAVSEDDDEEQEREGVQLKRAAAAVGSEIYDTMSDQVAKVKRLHGDEVKHLVEELRTLLDRATKAEAKLSLGTAGAERARERAEADFDVVVGDLAILEDEVKRLKARQRKHEVVGKMQGLFGKATKGADAAELTRLLTEERQRSARLEEVIVAAEEQAVERTGRVSGALSDEIQAKEQALGKLAETSAALNDSTERAKALEASNEELQKHVTATDARIEKLNASHAEAIREAREQLEAEVLKAGDAAKTINEMRFMLAKMDSDTKALMQASASSKLELEELRAKLALTESNLGKQRAQVTTLRMRAAAAMEEVRWTREQMSKAGSGPEALMEMEEAFSAVRKRFKIEHEVTCSELRLVEMESAEGVDEVTAQMAAASRIGQREGGIKEGIFRSEVVDAEKAMRGMEIVIEELKARLEQAAADSEVAAKAAEQRESELWLEAEREREERVEAEIARRMGAGGSASGEANPDDENAVIREWTHEKLANYRMLEARLAAYEEKYGSDLEGAPPAPAPAPPVIVDAADGAVAMLALSDEVERSEQEQADAKDAMARVGAALDKIVPNMANAAAAFEELFACFGAGGWHEANAPLAAAVAAWSGEGSPSSVMEHGPEHLLARTAELESYLGGGQREGHGPGRDSGGGVCEANELRAAPAGGAALACASHPPMGHRLQRPSRKGWGGLWRRRRAGRDLPSRGGG